MKQVTVVKEFQIPGTEIILEKGDQIQINEKVFDITASIKKDKEIDANKAGSYGEMMFQPISAALGKYITDKKSMNEALKFFRVLKQKLTAEMEYLQRTFKV